MNPSKPQDTPADTPNKIQIEDLPMEEGTDEQAENTRGGGYVLQDVMVTSVRPKRS